MPGKPMPTLYQPQLALQLGVTGHRKLGLAEDAQTALENRITLILKDIATAYRQFAASAAVTTVLGRQTPLPPRLLSPLAEGADSVVATAALAADYQLHCPLPFPSAIYADDFTGQALASFQNFRQHAHRVLELDGKRDNPDQAYRYVGHFVLRHSDMLLAVWDGNKDDLSPGTAGMIASAFQSGLPILWIKPNAPDDIQFHDPREGQPEWQPWDNAMIADVLAWCLLPHHETMDEAKPKRTWLQFWQTRCHIERLCCLAYYQHPEPKRNALGTVYRTLFAWFGKRSIKGMLGNPYRTDADYQAQTLGKAAQPTLSISSDILKYFVHADSLATYYADQYRGTFVATYTLGGFAVLWALLGGPFEGGHGNESFAWLEIFTIGTIALLIARGRLFDLHQRWVDFRLLAERLRQFAILAPIGGLSQSSQPVFHSHGDHSYTMVDWLVCTISRNEGIPAASFSANYRKAYQDFLLAMLTDQASYHENNHKRNHRIAHALHTLNGILLFTIVVACGLHILWHEPVVAKASTIIAAVLPAFGAAVAGVLSQGEFERIARRSEGMANHLNKIKQNLARANDASVWELALQAHLAIDTMSQELYDWRVIFRAKPLEQHA